MEYVGFLPDCCFVYPFASWTVWNNGGIGLDPSNIQLWEEWVFFSLFDDVTSPEAPWDWFTNSSHMSYMSPPPPSPPHFGSFLTTGHNRLEVATGGQCVELVKTSPLLIRFIYLELSHRSIWVLQLKFLLWFLFANYLYSIHKGSFIALTITDNM